MQQTISARRVWRMPIRPERYDRSPLSDEERIALAGVVSGKAPLNSPARKGAKATLARLMTTSARVARLSFDRYRRDLRSCGGGTRRTIGALVPGLRR